MADTTVKQSSPALIAAAWLLVLLPTGWGLTYTVQNAKKLFTSAPPAAAPATPTAATPVK